MSRASKKPLLKWRWKWSYLPLAIVCCYAIGVPLLWPEPTADFARALQPPSGEFIAGTDHYGFDLFTRTALGLRVSLFIGVISALCATTIGVIIGLTAAVRGGIVDRFLMRATDAVNSIPHLILSVVIVALFRGSIPALLISIAITHWPQTARIVRSTVLAARESEYVAASYGAGASKGWVLRQHLFPAAVGQTVVSVMMLIPHAVWHESALSFLGLGLQPDFPSLGTLIDQSRGDILTGAWWVLAVPGVALAVSTLSLVAIVPRQIINPEKTQGAEQVVVAGTASADSEHSADVFGVQHLSVAIPTKNSPVEAVRDATLVLKAGHVHGLIGGSGSGKTTLGRALCGHAPAGSTVSGTIMHDSDKVALLPQSASTSFTPVRRIGAQITEVIDASGQTSVQVSELLKRVNLDPAIADCFVHQLLWGNGAARGYCCGIGHRSARSRCR